MRRTLHDEVLERLRDMIIEGRLAPGQRINEGQVGAQLGVSRTPLREAIKTLASEGLVEILPAKGAIVRKFSARDLADILEVIKSLEQLGGRIACAEASDATIESIHKLHRDMLALYATRDRLDYFKLNQAIHSAIVAASGNAVLAEMHTTLQSRIKRLRFVGNEGPEKWAGAVAEHEDMMAALLRRDGDALAEAIGRHMDTTLVRVREVL
ncbi:MAG: GntR family transcriptional regulator [Proteobacteria bacterium]|nr:GntR family transcriptional regulator [Pseudomonadota bacterium]